MATERLNLQEQKKSKIIAAEAIRGMKMKLYRNVHNISLYKNCVFVAVARGLVAMVT